MEQNRPIGHSFCLLFRACWVWSRQESRPYPQMPSIPTNVAASGYEAGRRGAHTHKCCSGRVWSRQEDRPYPQMLQRAGMKQTGGPLIPTNVAASGYGAGRRGAHTHKCCGERVRSKQEERPYPQMLRRAGME